MSFFLINVLSVPSLKGSCSVMMVLVFFAARRA